MTEYDYQQIDDLIHSRIRLAIMAALAALGSASFSIIKEKIGATDGNLSVHLRKLEEAHYVQVEKTFMDRKPLSIYSITDQGRQAMKTYVEYLENMLLLPSIKDHL